MTTRYVSWQRIVRGTLKLSADNSMRRYQVRHLDGEIAHLRFNPSLRNEMTTRYVSWQTIGERDVEIEITTVVLHHVINIRAAETVSVQLLEQVSLIS